MENYLLAGLGILVSIILFLIGYRQTIGAKKERISAANSDIEKILIRRIVIENYIPNLDDLFRINDSKAREFKIKNIELIQPEQLLNNIYTRIVETDFLNQIQRAEILKQINPAMIQSKKIEFKEGNDYLFETSFNKKNIFNSISTTAIIAITSTTVGTLFSLLPVLNSLAEDIMNQIELASVIAITSFTFILMFTIYKKYKDSYEETPISKHSSRMEQGIKFEKEVAKVLSSKYDKVKSSGPKYKGYDFEVYLKDHKILVEVKYWNQYLPLGVIKRTLEQLSNAIKKENANEGLIIINQKILLGDVNLQNGQIKILTLEELKSLRT